MKWNPSNRDWYVSKEYKFTRWHDEFIINIHDLKPNSTFKINFKCDYCSTEYTRSFRAYHKIKIKDQTGKDTCDDCRKIWEAENSKTKLINKNKIHINKTTNLEEIISISVNDQNIKIKQCNTCRKYKEVTCFKKYDSKRMIYNKQCTECDKDFAELNKHKMKMYHISETSRKMNLPVNITENKLIKMQNLFNNSCALTDNEYYDIEHFIPVSWGHGGTYIGNVYPLRRDLNASKDNINPFKWVKKKNIKDKINMRKWNKLIKYLADRNGLTVNEFKNYIYWCERNKRSKEEVLKDNRMSIEIWKDFIKTK